ncbi:MAG: TMEM175 family protein [Micavibrio sp.]|nr:TMEM175 family protein [Micavibrio sp.]
MSAGKDITPARLEAFSDGVIAVIITIMVLELKVPEHDSLEALMGQWHTFVAYALSFLLVAEYWMNHQLLFHMIRRVDTRTLWTNLLLLFTISLIPLFTGFMSEHQMSPFSTAAYSAYMVVCSFSFLLLFLAISRHFEGEGEEARCKRRAGIMKSAAAIALYGLAVPVALYQPFAALALNFMVGGLYFVPTAWLERKENPKG